MCHSPIYLFGVGVDRLVVADEVVLDLARLTHVVHRVPVDVDARSTADALVHDVLNELVE